MLCFKNDPSAGSPTDTVLRLLHPLDDKAHDTSLRRAMQGTSDYSGPCNLPIINRFEAPGGVYKGQGRNQTSDDLSLLGIPRS